MAFAAVLGSKTLMSASERSSTHLARLTIVSLTVAGVRPPGPAGTLCFLTPSRASITCATTSARAVQSSASCQAASDAPGGLPAFSSRDAAAITMVAMCPPAGTEEVDIQCTSEKNLR